jgi:hypothetical protein
MAGLRPFEAVSAQFEAMALPTINLRIQPAYLQVRRSNKRGPLNHGQVYVKSEGKNSVRLGSSSANLSLNHGQVYFKSEGKNSVRLGRSSTTLV